MDEAQAQQTLSIPSLLAFAVVSFFAIRYFFFSEPAGAGSPSSRSNAASLNGRSARRRHNFPPDRVDTVVNMFPQLSRRDVEWDLLSNGGSVQATTERVLTTGRLPNAPANFTPIYASPPAANPAPSTQRSSQRPQQTYQDLITRYNLGSRINATPPVGDGPTGDAIQSTEKQREKGGWTTNKVDRQALLKQRREDMILAARRKMEEKDRKGKDRVA